MDIPQKLMALPGDGFATESFPKRTDVVRPEVVMNHSHWACGQGGIQATLQEGMVQPQLSLGRGEEGRIPVSLGENRKGLALLSMLWGKEGKEAGALVTDEGTAPCMCLAHGGGSGSASLPSLCSEHPILKLQEERSSESTLSLFLLVKIMHTFSPLLKRFSSPLKPLLKINST